MDGNASKHNIFTAKVTDGNISKHDITTEKLWIKCFQAQRDYRKQPRGQDGIGCLLTSTPPSREQHPDTAEGEEEQNVMALKSQALMWQAAPGCLRWKSATHSRAWMLS